MDKPAADLSKLHVVIVDDEPLAQQRLEDLLSEKEHVEVCAVASDGQEAVTAIRRHDPDLVFLDIQMPGLTGLDVIQTIKPAYMPVTIFVTAYDQHAVKAFELAALDYLLKPFDDERFEQAFQRAQQLIALREVDAMKERLLTLLRGPAESAAPLGDMPATPTSYLERIAVEMRGQVRVVPVDEVDYITASGPYAELHVRGDTYLIREQMQTLEDRLDPSLFFRIHRSSIVRLELIESLLLGSGGDYAVVLRGGHRLKVSRGRREELEQRLGLHTLK